MNISKRAYQEKSVALALKDDSMSALVPPHCRGATAVRNRLEEIGFEGKSERYSLKNGSEDQQRDCLNFLLSIPTPHIFNESARERAFDFKEDLSFPAQSYLLSKTKRPEPRLKMPDTFDEDLYPFQQGNVWLATKRKRHLFGDKMGLGKTPQALGTLEYLEEADNESSPFPCLLVCKPSKIGEMVSECQKFIPERSVYVLEGTKRPTMPPNIDIYIIHYQIMYAWVEMFERQSFNSVVLDECHKIKNEDSGINETTFAAVDEDTEVRLALSGTPIEKGPQEWVQTLKFLGILDDIFNGDKKFLKRYCGASLTKKPWGIHYELGDPQNLEELNKILRCKVMTRHQMDDVYEQLPEKTREFIPVKVDQEKIEQVERNALKKAEKRKRERIQEVENDISKLEMKLSTFDEEDDSEDVEDVETELEEKREKLDNLQSKGPWAGVEYQELRGAFAELKVEAVIEKVREIMEESEQSAVVFAHHRNEPHPVIPKLLEESSEYNPVKIVGGQDDDVQERHKQKFQDKKRRLMIASATVASESIELTASKRFLFGELLDKPSTHQQAEARGYARLSDPHGIIASYFYVEDTVDEAVVWKLEDRADTVATSLGDTRQSSFNPEKQDHENQSVKELSEKIMKEKYEGEFG